MRKVYPVLFFGFVMMLVFWKVIFHSNFTLLTGFDLSAQAYPWLDVASYWLKKGTLLLWDPYVYSGKATLGELQPGILYPLNWLVMIVPSRLGGVNLDAMQALLILEFVLAGYFCYQLARSFNISHAGSGAAGVAFALGGYTVSIYGWTNIFGGFIWMPLIFLFFRKALLAPDWKFRFRWLLWSACCLAVSLLAGHHGPPIQSSLLLFLYTLFTLIHDWKHFQWKAKIGNLATLGAVAALAILLTAVQWLPSAEWARRVFRWVGEGDPIRWGEKIPLSVLQSTGNIGPQDVLSLLLPYVSSSANIYVGVIILFLALVGLLFARQGEARFFGAASFIYLFVSWGQFSILHGWMNTFIPGLWFAREVYLYLVPFQLCLALLAGWGLDCLVNGCGTQPDEVFRVFIRRAGWGLALVVLSSAILIATLHLQTQTPIEHPYIRGLGALATYTSVLGVLLFFLYSGRIRPDFFRVLVVAVMVMDLGSNLSGDILPKSSRPGGGEPSVQSLWPKAPAAEFLIAKRRQEYFRVDDPAQMFPPNFGDVWRLEATMGHGATALVNYLNFRDLGWGPGSNVSALLNLRYLPSRTPIPWMKKVFEGGDAVYRNPRAVPRAFVVSRYRSFRSQQEVMNWLWTPLLSPRGTLLLLDKDLKMIAPALRSGLRSEDHGIDVRVISCKTAATKEIEALPDEAARAKLFLFQPPWGWSAGDEITLGIRPEAPVEHCYLTMDYYPVTSGPSTLVFRLEGRTGSREIRAELDGSQKPDREASRRASVDLGRLEVAEYRLSFMKAEGMSINLDSLGVTRAQPEEDGNAGEVEITSYRPNSLKLTAELTRPSFVVVSEIFYPGWEALVDGERVPLLVGDYILRAVAVPAGKHEIEFRFRSKTFQWGLVVSLVSLSGVIAFLVTTRK